MCRILILEMNARNTSYWAWGNTEWVEVIGANKDAFRRRCKFHECRCLLMAFSYIATGFVDFHRCGWISSYRLSMWVFGKSLVDEAIHTTRSELMQLGYGDMWRQERVAAVLCKVLLASRTPTLEGIKRESLLWVRDNSSSKSTKENSVSLSQVLLKLGIISEALRPRTGMRMPDEDGTTDGVPSEWLSWCRKWLEITTVGPVTRAGYFYALMKVGRWIGKVNIKLASPQAWEYEDAIEFIAAISRSKVGEWAARTRLLKNRIGKPLMPASIAGTLTALRVFFRDCHEWGWLERRFDPGRALRTPRSIRTLIVPNPRVIADDIWAKLLWAGLNVTESDLPTIPCNLRHGGKFKSYYPLEMVRALAVVWLFAGLRANEIRRLRVGCIRWQREEVTIPSTGEVLPEDAVCLLDVPVNKTTHAFTKPVDPIVGEAIGAWESIRPEQPLALDPKTKEMVHYLFFFRGKRVGMPFVNERLIPILCNKAGLPEKDARGTITAHRARSTIASQLYNAKEPFTLNELQEWLGHKNPNSTQFYAQVSPTRLAKKYADAGYFRRNIRTIEVLIDRDVIASGAAARGEPWQYYDLGHGWCVNAYFVECPHRMACAKCTFYVPKASSQAQFIEGKSNLLHMRQEIPLTEAEVLAVDEGIEAFERLTERLVDVPTPAGPTPRQLIQLTRSKKADS
jgi:integrase